MDDLGYKTLEKMRQALGTMDSLKQPIEEEYPTEAEIDPFDVEAETIIESANEIHLSAENPFVVKLPDGSDMVLYIDPFTHRINMQPRIEALQNLSYALWRVQNPSLHPETPVLTEEERNERAMLEAEILKKLRNYDNPEMNDK